MKYAIAVFFTVLLLGACKKETETSRMTINEAIDTVGQTTLFTGNFMNGPWGSAGGQVRVLRSSNGSLSLALLNVTVSSGPDLRVYLSKEIQPISFIDLGKLRSTSGNQVYTISGMPDFTQYKYALIHCQQFNHLFGSATLVQ